jgi:hypothetical protein
MRMRSTGLGKTELIGDIDEISREGSYLVLSLRTTDPVRWHVRTGIDGKDLRILLKMIFSFKVIKFAIFNIFSKRPEGAPPPTDF